MIEWVLILITSDPVLTDKWGDSVQRFPFKTEQICEREKRRWLAISQDARASDLKNLVIQPGQDPITAITNTLARKRPPDKSLSVYCVKRHKPDFRPGFKGFSKQPG